MAHLVWGPGGRYSTPIRSLYVIGVAIVIAWLLIVVWPTRSRYIATGDRLYRVDRLTACYQYATDTGWSRPWQRTC